MLKKLNKNIKFFRRYWCEIAPKSLRSEKFSGDEPSSNIQPTIVKDQTMNPIKSLLFFVLKLVIFLVLTNIILVKPLSNAISKGLEGFDNNPLMKIISLDFINNPLTFIRMSEYYLDKNDFKKAQLYLQYAETIKARYPYPLEVNAQLLELRTKIKNIPK
jgi:hypothetical protein